MVGSWTGDNNMITVVVPSVTGDTHLRRYIKEDICHCKTNSWKRVVEKNTGCLGSLWQRDASVVAGGKLPPPIDVVMNPTSHMVRAFFDAINTNARGDTCN